MILEYQRYGRNKSTLVNKTYIESGEYRRKFDNATDNPMVNKALYECAKTALRHRSGTVFEDMYWLDGSTGRVILSVIDSSSERAVVYPERIKKEVRMNKNLITIHTHPSSMPPSVDDFNSCFKNGYKMCFIACHNGKVYRYSAQEEVNGRLYNMYVGDFLKNGYDEFQAQIGSLEKIKKNFAVEFEEVT